MYIKCKAARVAEEEAKAVVKVYAKFFTLGLILILVFLYIYCYYKHVYYLS